MSKTIVTHTSPDFDAICYIWLIRRFVPGFENVQIEFMPLNAIDRQDLDAADSVGDMGGVYDPERLRFDHHHFEGQRSTATCAAMQAWHWLLANDHQDLEYLKPLIVEIYQGDLARTPPVGIHAMMFGWKALTKEAGRRLLDREILDYGFHILDQVAFWLEKKGADRDELKECVVWKSEDNLIWTIKDGGVGTSFAAYDEGARVVVFQGNRLTLADSTTTYPVGASRAPEWQEPNLGELVRNIVSGIDAPTYVGIKAELTRWFCHNAGVYAGRGGPKAPDPEPLGVNLVEIAQAIHLAWER